MSIHCTWCGQAAARITACERDRLCPRCTDAYLEQALGDMIARYYGEPYRNARGNALPVTPRSNR
jgi:hypothetical protein